MVDSEVSGVAFSAHPVTGSREHMVVEVVSGLGEALVSGEITPDTYVVEAASGDITESYITPQAKQLRRDTAGYTSWQAIEPPQTTAKLSQEQRVLVVSATRKIASLYGFPVDIEWAFAHGTLYILQARHITNV